MLRRVALCIGTAALMAAMALGVAAAPKQAVDVRATLRGTVTGEDLVKPGDDVIEGAALVYVRTETGRGVAARAPADGRITDVFVRPGTAIRELGTVVARLDPK